MTLKTRHSHSVSVLFAFKHPHVDNPSACHVGMGVTASNAVMTLREARIAADYRPVKNGEYLWARLAKDWSQFTHVVLCAPFIDAPFLGKLIRNFPSIQFALIYHSNLGFLSVDRFAANSLPDFLALDRQNANFCVSGNSAEFALAISGATGYPVVHLPNLYHLPHAVRRQRSAWKPGMPLHVGLFGAARVLKNWLTAAVSVMIIQRSLNAETYLHISSGRDEGAGSMRDSLAGLVALNPRVHLVDVPWLSADDFRRYLYGMDLLLQPSFTETFNNVTADGAYCGVPSVVSDAIDWVPSDWVAKADSAHDIAQTGCHLIEDPTAGPRGWHALDRYDQGAIAIWRSWLGIADPAGPPATTSLRDKLRNLIPWKKGTGLGQS